MIKKQMKKRSLKIMKPEQLMFAGQISPSHPEHQEVLGLQ